MPARDRSAGSRLNSAGLARDVEILELLGSPEAVRAGGLGVVRIAQLTGRDKGAVSRALATLADSGLAERDDESLGYRVGHRLFGLAARTRDAELLRAARHHLRRISLATRETSHLCVLRGGNVLTLHSELSRYEIRTTGWEGVTTAAWRTPSGRVLLSDWDEESLAQWYAEHGHDAAVVSRLNTEMAGLTVLEQPPVEKAVVTDFPSLLAELEHIRKLGYATLDEELEHGVVGASAPVYDFTDRIVAAINVSAPKARIGGQLDNLGTFVARASLELSTALGATRPGP